MKLCFFKDYTDFYFDMYSCFENAERVESKNKAITSTKIKIRCFTSVVALLYTIIFAKKLCADILLMVLIWISFLPLHELCHVLFCILNRTKVEGIYFFPKDKKRGYDAYVLPRLAVWKKSERILFSLFPLIVLSVASSVLSFVFPRYAIWFIYFGLINLVTSYVDISDAYVTWGVQHDALWLGGLPIRQKDKTIPIQVHFMYVIKESKTIEHEHYQYFKGKTIKIDNPIDNEDVKMVKRKYAEYFESMN